MSKAKRSLKKPETSAEPGPKTGAEVLQARFENAAERFGTAVEFGKDNAHAYKTSAVIAGKGIKVLNSEMQAYSTQLFEGSIAATKAIMASNSFYEAIELQTEFAKSVLEAYVTQLTKVSELSATVAKDSLVPIRERVDAFVQAVQLTYE